MAKTPDLRTGEIILARVRDPNTGAILPKPHPAVILSQQGSIAAGNDLIVAVCTTSCARPWPSGWFSMPATPGAPHPVTGLSEATVVKATWIDIVPQGEVIKVYGRSPKQVFKQVANWLVLCQA